MTNRNQTGSRPKPSRRGVCVGAYLEMGSSPGLTAVRLQIGSSKSSPEPGMAAGQGRTAMLLLKTPEG